MLVSPAQPADDWTFVAGKFAVTSGDCRHVAKGRPLSRALAKQIRSEVLTREGITSPRETHCRFRSATRAGSAKWTVKAACEELGVASADLEDVAVTRNPDGSLDVVAQDTFGPEALKFRLCR
ncbi:MAG: hypothetical protein ACRECO_06795 [Xanthobacteraceae bacterium]